jgi:hypothetical protein
MLARVASALMAYPSSSHDVELGLHGSAASRLVAPEWLAEVAKVVKETAARLAEAASLQGGGGVGDGTKKGPGDGVAAAVLEVILV